jgi:hypothetical protein
VQIKIIRILAKAFKQHVASRIADPSCFVLPAASQSKPGTGISRLPTAGFFAWKWSFALLGRTVKTS